MSKTLEKQIGFALATIAVIWAAYHIVHQGELDAYIRLGPMQLLMLGLITWLHGKYRNARTVLKSN